MPDDLALEFVKKVEARYRAFHPFSGNAEEVVKCDSAPARLLGDDSWGFRSDKRMFDYAACPLGTKIDCVNTAGESVSQKPFSAQTFIMKDNLWTQIIPGTLQGSFNLKAPDFIDLARLDFTVNGVLISDIIGKSVFTMRKASDDSVVIKGKFQNQDLELTYSEKLLQLQKARLSNESSSYTCLIDGRTTVAGLGMPSHVLEAFETPKEIGAGQVTHIYNLGGVHETTEKEVMDFKWPENAVIKDSKTNINYRVRAGKLDVDPYFNKFTKHDNGAKLIGGSIIAVLVALAVLYVALKMRA